MATALLTGWGAPAPYLIGTLAAGQIATLGSTNLTVQYNGIGMVWAATMTDTITDIGYHQGTTTLTPGANYRVALFPVTTGGLPNTGATFANATLGSVTATTFTPAAANDNKWVWINLGANTFSVTQGQEFAIVIWKNDVDVTDSISVNGSLSNFMLAGLPVFTNCAAGTWSKTTTGDYPLLGMKSASNTYGRPFSTSSFLTSNLLGGTTESGMVFTMPTNFCSTYVVRGVRALIRTPGTHASNTYQANLYSSPTSSPVQIAKSALVIFDRFGASSKNFSFLELYFTSGSTLTAGTQYGIGLSGTTASDSGIYSLDQVAQADFNAWEGQQSTIFASRTASTFAGINTGTATGNFATTVTKRAMMELILDDLTAPAAGGMLYVPNMDGT